MAKKQDVELEKLRLVHWRMLIGMGCPTLEAMRSIDRLSKEDLVEMYPNS